MFYFITPWFVFIIKLISTNFWCAKVCKFFAFTYSMLTVLNIKVNQWSFWVLAQPMEDNITLLNSLSLAESITRMIPVNIYLNCLDISHNWIELILIYHSFMLSGSYLLISSPFWLSKEAPFHYERSLVYHDSVQVIFLVCLSYLSMKYSMMNLYMGVWILVCVLWLTVSMNCSNHIHKIWLAINKRVFLHASLLHVFLHYTIFLVDLNTLCLRITLMQSCFFMTKKFKEGNTA